MIMDSVRLLRNRAVFTRLVRARSQTESGPQSGPELTSLGWCTLMDERFVVTMTMSSKESRSSDSSIVHVPPITASHPLLRSLPPMTQLPVDLLDLLNQAYFLHLLANDPSKVLPAGKSLLSVMSRPHVMRRGNDELPTLQEKVEVMVHKAFWDEVPPP